jgi:hypothetical protein
MTALLVQAGASFVTVEDLIAHSAWMMVKIVQDIRLR